MFLIFALAGGERSASRLGRFASREEARGCHLMGSWLVPRAGLVAAEKRNLYCHSQESNCDSSAVRPFRNRSCYTDLASDAIPLHVSVTRAAVSSDSCVGQ
jgi:hypothetical protein